MAMRPTGTLSGLTKAEIDQLKARQKRILAGHWERPHIRPQNSANSADIALGRLEQAFRTQAWRALTPWQQAQQLNEALKRAWP